MRAGVRADLPAGVDERAQLLPGHRRQLATRAGRRASRSIPGQRSGPSTPIWSVGAKTVAGSRSGRGSAARARAPSGRRRRRSRRGHAPPGGASDGLGERGATIAAPNQQSTIWRSKSSGVVESVRLPRGAQTRGSRGRLRRSRCRARRRSGSGQHNERRVNALPASSSPDRGSRTIASMSACSCPCSTRSATSARRSPRCRRSASTARSSCCSPTAAPTTARARSCSSWPRSDPRIRVLDNPRAADRQRAERLPARGARRVRRADGRAHLLRASAISRPASSACAAATPIGSAAPRSRARSGRSRGAVALALASWLGRGGSRKWSEDLARRRGARARHAACSAASGGASACSRRAAGTSAGRSTRTPRWPRASCADGARLVCLPEMAGYYVPRDSLDGARAPVLPLRLSTGRAPSAATRRACAARI